MDIQVAALLAIRVLLAAVFIVAGGAKLADRDSPASALREFGIPPVLAGPIGIGLPWVELLAAFALLPSSTAWYGAVAALSLLVGFTAAIALSLARGRRPDCHCFGQLHAAPAGWSTLGRNAVLALLAGFVVWQGPAAASPSAIAWAADLSLVERVASLGGAAALALLALQTFILVQVLRQQGRLLSRMDALESASRLMPATGAANAPAAAGRAVGSPAPAFTLQSLQGGRVALADILTAGTPALLVFTNPSCGPCSALLPEIARWQREANGFNFVLISEGSAEDNRASAKTAGLTQVLLQDKREVAEAFMANGTPAALLVRPDGSIGSPLALGADAIRSLVVRALAASPNPPAPPLSSNGREATPPALARPFRKPVTLGEPVPSMQVADLGGNSIAVTSLKGEPTLLLFWNTGCGFCRRMLDDLRAWDADPPLGAPRLVLVSAGEIEDIRAMGLRSLALLDHDNQIAAAFGANGTPMAVLLDAEGRVASNVAAGATAVFALARGAGPASHNGAGRGAAQPALP